MKNFSFILLSIYLIVASCSTEKAKTGLWFYPIAIDSLTDNCFSITATTGYKDSMILVGMSRWNADMENYGVIDYEQDAYLYTSNNHGKKFKKRLLGKGSFTNFSLTKNYLYTAIKVLKPGTDLNYFESTILRSADGGIHWDTLDVMQENILRIEAFSEEAIAIITIDQFSHQNLLFSSDQCLNSRSIYSGNNIRNLIYKDSYLYLLDKEMLENKLEYNTVHVKINLETLKETKIKYNSSFEPQCFFFNSKKHLVSVGIIGNISFIHDASSDSAPGHFRSLKDLEVYNPYKLYEENEDLYIFTDQSIIIQKKDSELWEYLESISDIGGETYIKNNRYMVGSKSNNYTSLIYVIR